MSVREKVRAYIETHRLNPTAVAQKAGIPAAVFNDILNEKRAMYADELRAVCLALNVSPETFIDFNPA